MILNVRFGSCIELLGRGPSHPCRSMHLMSGTASAAQNVVGDFVSLVIMTTAVKRYRLAALLLLDGRRQAIPYVKPSILSLRDIDGS